MRSGSFQLVLGGFVGYGFWRCTWQHSPPVAPVLPPHINPCRDLAQVPSPACSLGRGWSSTSPVQQLCHPIPNSWGRNSACIPVCEPSGMVAACSFLGGDRELWKCTLLALVCTPGQGGFVKHWDLPLLGRAGREMQIMSFPCHGEVQKAVGIPGFPMSPGQRVSGSLAQGASRSCLAQATA